MSAAFVQAKGGHTSAGVQAQISLTGVASGNHLFAAGGAFRNLSGAILTAASSSPSATWTTSRANDDWNYTGTNFLDVRGDHSENVASGSWTVNINATNSGSITGLAAESSGVATSSSLGVAGGAHVASNSGAQPGSQTPTAGSIMYTWMADDSSNTAVGTLSANWTVISDTTFWDGSNTFERCGAGYRANVPGTAENPTINESSGTANFNIAMVEFLAAASSGIPPGLGPVVGMLTDMQSGAQAAMMR